MFDFDNAFDAEDWQEAQEQERKAADIVPYAQTLRRSERRRIEERMREMYLNEELHARHHRSRLANAYRLKQQAIQRHRDLPHL
jgi:hypothetical protein